MGLAVNIKVIASDRTGGIDAGRRRVPGTGNIEDGNHASATPNEPAITGLYRYNALGATYAFVRTADGGITTFFVPGTSQTNPQGINAAGAIAGYYLDGGGYPHGFTRVASGALTLFDVQGSTQTNPTGINDGGLIAGHYYSVDGRAHGFLRDPVDLCEPPVINSLSANPSILGPPNHKMVPVGLTLSASNGCGAISSAIVSVTSNEPVSADGDWEVTGALTLKLRAERLGTGTGRVYSVTVRTTDASANSATRATVVSVPHN